MPKNVSVNNAMFDQKIVDTDGILHPFNFIQHF